MLIQRWKCSTSVLLNMYSAEHIEPGGPLAGSHDVLELRESFRCAQSRFPLERSVYVLGRLWCTRYQSLRAPCLPSAARLMPWRGCVTSECEQRRRREW